MAFMVSYVPPSILMMLLSTFDIASKISFLCNVVPFVKTLIFALGKYKSRSLIVMSIMSTKSGFNVGSPLPENVMLSGSSAVPLSSCSLFSNACSKISFVGIPLFFLFSGFHPHSQ